MTVTGDRWLVTDDCDWQFVTVTVIEDSECDWYCCLLVAPSNMRVYLRDGSSETSLRAATLR